MRRRRIALDFDGSGSVTQASVDLYDEQGRRSHAMTYTPSPHDDVDSIMKELLDFRGSQGALFE